MWFSVSSARINEENMLIDVLPSVDVANILVVHVVVQLHVARLVMVYAVMQSHVAGQGEFDKPVQHPHILKIKFKNSLCQQKWHIVLLPYWPNMLMAVYVEKMAF